MAKDNKKLDRATIADMHRRGFSTSEIASAIGARSPQYVGELIRKLSPSDYIDVGKIKALYKAGWNTWMIADECSVSEREVRELCQ